MLISRKRFALAAAVAGLFVLPSPAAAKPAGGPELVQRSGRLVIVHADLRDGSATRQWTLVHGSDALPVRAPDDVWIEPGTPVRLEGTMRNGTLVLADSLTAVRRTGPSPLQAAPAPVSAGLAAMPTMHNTAVILFGFTDGPDMTELPTDADGARSLMFDDPTTSLNAYYREQSYDQIGFSGQVFGPYDIAGPTGTCSYSSSSAGIRLWQQQAEAAAGITDTQFDHYVFVYPELDACPFAGIAEVGGSHVWINGDFEVPVVAHELGHNLGLAHAGGLQCSNGGTPVPMGTSCSGDTFDYKDPFDAMGQSDPFGGGALVLRQMSMQHKLKLNLLPPTAVQVVAGAGSYRIAPMETLSGTAELLRIPKPGGGNYFVEYRRPIGWFDSQAPAFAGVYIRTESPIYPNADTALIDMHPTTGPSQAPWADARMTIGQVFTDAVLGISIQNLGEDAGGATLAITLPSDTVPPGRPGRLSAVASGNAVTLDWTAASDNFGVASYQVTRDGALVGTPSLTEFTDTGLAAGSTLAYTVAAVDGAGNVGPAVPVTVTVPDSERPTTPAGVRATVTRDGQVHVAWGASTDNGHLYGYQVLRSGIVIATPATTAYVDKTPSPGAGATVTYSVVALDLAGNTSFPGNAPPLRAALLRKLGVANVKVVRAKQGKRKLVRVKGTVSDVEAVCRVRIARGPWHSCKAKPTGAFNVSLRAKGKKPVTVSLRDELGRVKLQTLRVR